MDEQDIIERAIVLFYDANRGAHPRTWGCIDEIERGYWKELAEDDLKWERKTGGGNYDTLAEKKMDSDDTGR